MTVSLPPNSNFYSGCTVVKNERACTTCRECIRHDKFAPKINLGKRKDIFEFHVESLGIYKPEEIVFQALDVLKEKAHKWMDILAQEEL